MRRLLFFRFVRELYPGFQFENVKVIIETPNQAFGGYEFTAVFTKTGRPIHQLFLGRMVTENREIELLREALNTVEVARAIMPNGVSDLL